MTNHPKVRVSRPSKRSRVFYSEEPFFHPDAEWAQVHLIFPPLTLEKLRQASEKLKGRALKMIHLIFGFEEDEDGLDGQAHVVFEPFVLTVWLKGDWGDQESKMARFFRQVYGAEFEEGL